MTMKPPHRDTVLAPLREQGISGLIYVSVSDWSTLIPIIYLTDVNVER